jgi:hypothetical protein
VLEHHHEDIIRDIVESYLFLGVLLEVVGKQGFEVERPGGEDHLVSIDLFTIGDQDDIGELLLA